MNKALIVDQVSKTFKRESNQPIRALDQASLEINSGQIYGLLGPNGAGKSTMISLISGIHSPDSGHISLFGIDVEKSPEEAKKLLGVVPQEITVEPAFTVEEVLYYFSGMYGVPAQDRPKRIAEVLEDLSLSDKKNDRARSLSGGMKRRLMIAKAIMHKPKLLILDEPTAGVDVALRKKVWDLVRRLNKEGTTILFTTHYLEEAEELCESITFIDQGKVIKQGKLHDIQREYSQNLIYFELFDHSTGHLENVRRIGLEYELPITNFAEDLNKITKFYDANLKSIRNEAASLEKIFLELTGK